MNRFYTAFLLSPKSTEHHCTHKYLGPLHIEDMHPVVDLIRKFNPEQHVPFVVRFREERIFDPNVRVLIAEDKAAFRSHWADLRAALGELGQADQYPWNPHVSTNAHDLMLFFTHYALCVGKEVIYSWKMKGADGK